MPKGKRGRPRLSPVERAVEKERKFLLELHKTQVEAATASAEAVKGLTQALAVWFEMFKVNSTPHEGWTNTDASEFVRWKAAEEGIPGRPDPRAPEADQIRWLMSEMEKE